MKMVKSDNKNLIPNLNSSTASLGGNSLPGKIFLDKTRNGLKENLGRSEENKGIVMDSETIESLYGNEYAILNYLKENCITPKEGEKAKHVNKYGVKGIRYSLTLPSVNGSKCKIIDWFISDDVVDGDKYDSNQTWINNSSTINDISTKIFGNISNFLDTLGVSSEDTVYFVKNLFFRVDNYSDMVRNRAHYKYYFLKDENEERKQRNGIPARAGWSCHYGYHDLTRIHPSYNYEFLFLGLNVRELE